MKAYFENDWDQVLTDVIYHDEFTQLLSKVEEERKTYTIYPKQEDLFSAFQFTSYADTKVVILGQDPYHGVGQAHGLSFSVQPGIKIPPSLKNIYKELESDLGISAPNHGCLQSWARQGVLLLNTILTVRESTPLAHKKIGWERFTDVVIQKCNEREQPVIFVLWGKPAQAKKKLITKNHHLILESVHPSPLSARRGFFGSKPFSYINQFLQESNMHPIDWSIPAIE
ncbi:uracil-DNA glycosylase [Thermoactinomyces sp. DSM 45892]|uniref:uracil-DNA glycosylase n=1 Tax=Thermoactinomyces sp. DSM 45892 TaxID=1882753 RepID=UPI0008956025|nr:uracil-DNA glycosylase [Thermoactinomyces sp. DSM 45892]SDY50409.1 Uracil-DNA glycosylase [Thermoactinomyces sp. DSM 45892]